MYGFQVGEYDKGRPLVLDPAVLVYARYIGGADIDQAWDIAVDAAGNAYVAGFSAGDAFVAINLGSRGTVPVAILSSPAFDARTVDPATVTLASAPVKLKENGAPMESFEEVNSDGLADLVLHVSTELLRLTATDTEATLKGKTFGGMAIRGTDSVRVVP